MYICIVIFRTPKKLPCLLRLRTLLSCKTEHLIPFDQHLLHPSFFTFVCLSTQTPSLIIYAER
jgi:hypothetical protein